MPVHRMKVTQDGTTTEWAIPAREPFTEHSWKTTRTNVDGSTEVTDHRLRRTLPTPEYDLVDSAARLAAELAAAPEITAARKAAIEEGRSPAAAQAIADAKGAAIVRSVYESCFGQLFALVFEGDDPPNKFPASVLLTWGDASE